MTAVWYIGRADSRRITSDNWTAAGAPGDTKVWDKSNGWSLDAAGFTAAQLTLLDGMADFNINGADGPRPGAAVSSGDESPVKLSTLTNLGIAPAQMKERLFPFKRFGGEPMRASARRGPISTDFTAVTPNAAITGGVYNRQYLMGNIAGKVNGVHPPASQWPVDMGEGLPFYLSNFSVGYGSRHKAVRTWRVVCDGNGFAWYQGNGVDPFWIWVDGRPTNLNGYVPTANVAQFVEITFPSAKPRLIEVRTAGGLQAVYTKKMADIWKPPPRRGPRGLVMGDSWVGGFSGVTNFAHAMYSQMGALLGGDLWIDGIGSTGYGVHSTANGTDIPAAGVDRYLDRVNGVLLSGVQWDPALIKPDYVIVHGGGANDIYKGRTDEQIRADAETLFRTLRLKLPNARLIFVEGFAPPGFTPSTYNPRFIANRQALQTALADVDVYYIDVATTKPWIAGTGTTAAPTGIDNSDIYIVADTFHYNDVGGKYLMDRMAERIERVLLDDGTLANQLI